MSKTPDILIVVGSPQEGGRSGRLAKRMAEILESRGIHPCVYSLAEYPVAACTGCNVCGKTGECVIVNDGFGVLSRHMDSADAAIFVAPVFFAGPSAWMKAMLDRCQVYWSRRYMLKQPMNEYRPAHLVVIGEGGDPFGFKPLSTICTSALNSTGLRIDGNIYDFVGEKYSLDRAEEVIDSVLEQL